MGARRRVRKISGLEWAKWASAPGFACPGRQRMTKAQRAGLAFQKNVSKALAHFGSLLSYGPWVRFADRNGPGWAQPDLVIRGDGEVLVVEVKLSFTPRAIPQLEALYVPLLSYLAGVPIRRAILCRHLRPAAASFDPQPAEEVCWEDLPTGAGPAVLFWGGKGPILPGGI